MLTRYANAPKKFGDKDIREMGSGNAGASNVTSEMGWKFGIPTGISDVLKAYIPTQLVLLIFPVSSYQQIELISISGIGAHYTHGKPHPICIRHMTRN